MQHVKDVMTENPACCTADTDVQAVARMMCDHDCGEIPVVDGKSSMRPIGVITDRDIACRVVARGVDAKQAKARDCMTNDCVTVTRETGIEECCRLLEENQIRRVPVVDEDGRCVGIVSQADIALKTTPRKAGEVVRRVSFAAHV
ncbi:MAG: CBS domain-containing protein [Elusimicrobia bacterium]|nr:CBS domain-containing protein [Elusimicrobiota bacterium]